MEYCIEINQDKAKNFTEKWQEGEESPFAVDFDSTLVVNGKEVQQKQGCGMTWIPESWLPEEEENAPEAAQLLEHYHLDSSKAWVFQRFSYPWKRSGKTKLNTLEVKLERNKVAIPGPHFRNPGVGEGISFVHPVTGVVYQLKVQEYEPEKLEFDVELSEEYEFPTYHTAMTFTLEPELSEENFHVRDVLKNDQPRRSAVKEKKDGIASDIGIIGGADGPTAIFLAVKNEKKIHAALSALHFAPVEDVEWEIVFYEKMMKDIEIKLL